MNIIHRICCGIDVHAKTVVACLIKNGKKQIRTYSTMTDDLLALSDWLVSEGCEQVAIEHRCILEARVQHSGRSSRSRSGQRATR